MTIGEHEGDPGHHRVRQMTFFLHRHSPRSPCKWSKPIA